MANQDPDLVAILARYNEGACMVFDIVPPKVCDAIPTLIDCIDKAEQRTERLRLVVIAAESLDIGRLRVALANLQKGDRLGEN